MSVVEAPAWEAYAAGSSVDHFAWWTEEHCRHAVGPFAGKPLVFEHWQRRFFGEAFSVDYDDLPYWLTCVMVVPRKNGKTTGTSPVAAYIADEGGEKPIVGLAATSDEQASELFDAIGAFIAASPYLSERFHVRDYDGEIARTDDGGFIRRMKMDWRRLHGKNLEKLIADEIHAWSTPNLRRCWEALTTGDGARPSFQVFCITTEGEEDENGESILSMLVTNNERYGEVEHYPGLTISRNHDSRVIVYRYSAPMPAADPEPVREAHHRWSEARLAGDQAEPELRAAYEAALEVCVTAVKLANPASWVTPKYLGRKAIDPKLSRSAFLRFHACVSADVEEFWISEDQWAACLGGEHEPPAGAEVYVGADGARTGDCSALGFAWRNAHGGISVSAHVWGATKKVAAHEFAANGYIDNRDMIPVLEQLDERCTVREVVYDPRYLDTVALMLAEGGFTVADAWSNQGNQAKAWQAWRDGVDNQTIQHAGDRVLAAHVCSAIARETDAGWKVSKLPSQQRRKIDALIAVAMAHWRCQVAGEVDGWAEAW